MSIPTFKGFRRANGRVGVRNHVIILPVDDISNAACEAVANNIKGTLALPHAYGRLQFGEDLELFFRTMIGTGANPNVAACVVIGIEPGWTQRIVDGIAKTGKPVTGFSIERHGDLQTIAMASRKALEFVQDASELQREECKLSEVYISVKCGESDPTTGLGSCPTVGNVIDKTVTMGATASFGETSELTGGEQIVKAKAANAQVAEAFMKVWIAYTDAFILKEKTDDLSESQPTEGNIRGGLTTIEEKAMGNIEKLGRNTKVVGVLKPGRSRPRAKDSGSRTLLSAAAEAVTLWAASAGFAHRQIWWFGPAFDIAHRFFFDGQYQQASHQICRCAQTRRATRARTLVHGHFFRRGRSGERRQQTEARSCASLPDRSG